MSINNNKVIERLEQAHSAQIEKLFWIAASTENDDLASFLEEDMSDESWKYCFPELFESDYFEEYRENNELVTLLTEHEKLGFIAEVSIPRCYNFRYEGEELKDYSSNPGTRRLKYVYAENLEYLITAIEIVADEVFEDYKQIDLKEKSKPGNF